MSNSKKKKAQSTPRERFIAAVIKSRTPEVHRHDIADWQRALLCAQRADTPRFALLQELYTHIADDAHLYSQLQLRRGKVLGSDWTLYTPAGEPDEELTRRMASMPLIRQLMGYIEDSVFYGCSLVELQPDTDGSLMPVLIDRRHVQHRDGLLLVHQWDADGLRYREIPEYGRTVLEFRQTDDLLGLLNRAVPHALFKRFAQSCWSEFCEVCGMPPRIIKTNTQDPELRQKYLKMLQEYGTGANGIIDTDDELQFVATNATSGEAYEKLIRTCSNELSLLVNGAVMGQDTKFGSNSKEQSSQQLNDDIVAADQYNVETVMSRQVMPALAWYGLVPEGTTFRFSVQEDLKLLFDHTMQAAAWFEIDPEWVKDKFGIEVTGPRMASPMGEGLSLAAVARRDASYDPFV